nr:GyrI-like domain-containing protein [Psychrilyobacter piezotolerans]
MIGKEEYTLEELPPRNIARLSRNFSKKEDLEVAVREFEIKLKKLNLFALGKVGVVLNKDRLNLRNFSEYDALYFLLDDLESIDGFETLPGGTYASLYYRGSIEESKNYYPKILDYIDNMGYELIGPAFERAIISNSATSEKNEYVRKIEIPVKKS